LAFIIRIYHDARSSECQILGLIPNRNINNPLCVTNNSTFKYKPSQHHSCWSYRLHPQCRWSLRSSGLLRSECWFLFVDVSGQHIGPILLEYLTLEDGTNGLSRNFYKQIPSYAAQQPRTAKIPCSRCADLCICGYPEGYATFSQTESSSWNSDRLTN